MKRYQWIQSLVIGVSLAAAAACGSSGSSSANPASASAASTVAAPSLNLAGSWSGKLNNVNSNGGQGQTNPPSATWSATQSGSTVTGPFSLTIVDGGKSRTYTGTLTGTLSGEQLSLNLSFPSGAFPESAACTITGTGTATPTTTSISSTMAIVFAAPCVGTVSDRPSETDQLTLSKS
jgi:hypothetical protein